MRLLLLSDTYSEHTEKWALSLAQKGIRVGLFSFNKASYPWYENKENIELLFEPKQKITGSGIKEKLTYFKYLPILKSKIKSFQPNIIHAHYATSYGLIGVLGGRKPTVVSVWGSDVFDFPKQSWLNKRLLKFVLERSTYICSTSHCMKAETLLYTNKAIEVIPFGIDIEKFNRPEKVMALQNPNEVIIGNIKPLETKYGIDILIKAFHMVVKKFPDKTIQLYLIGEGNEKENYEHLASELGLKDKIIFTGRIPHDQIAEYHKKIDIFISLSILDSESFGVSLVEAMASRSCVVASAVAGFKEVMGDSNDCGFIVPKHDVESAAKAMVQFIEQPDLAKIKSENSRQRALQFYNWDDNVNQQIALYNSILKK
jgi:L-malate glycosyltransferase